MYPTTEVRWFFAGAIPPAVRSWFLALGHLPPLERRTDHYLRLPDVHTVGVKWREGRMEVKRRVGGGALVEFEPHVAGQVARWHKWSFALSESGALRALHVADDWVAVEKSRWLLTFAVDDKGNVREAPSWSAPYPGCEVELTTVRACEQTWWTFGFEAFGDDGTQRASLRASLQHVLQADSPLALTAEASASYPRWLATRLFDAL